MARIHGIDQDVFPLNLGGNPFGWTSDTATSHAVLDAFTESGGNFVDTADMYSQWIEGNSGGESERVIGQWMTARRNRESVVVATKVGAMNGFTGLGHDTVVAAVNNSLDRLGTDYVDLLYAHRDDDATLIENQVQTFDSLVKAGKVRAIGLSNYSPARLRSWIETARDLGATLPAAIQDRYNLVSRAGYERGNGPLATEFGLASFPFSGLASGFLSGKYRTREDLSQSPRGGAAETYLNEQGLAVVHALEEVASAHDTELSTVALAWLLAKDVVPIASVSRPEQLPALMAAPSLRLSDHEITRLDDASAPFAS